MDLNDNDMIIDDSDASQLATIQGLVKSGYNGGAWNGTGGISSTAAASAANLGKTALGVAESADVGLTSVDGVSITGNAVVVKYTYIGDSSLDGKVDLGNDFNLFLIGYLTPNSNTWELGDYNYDGVVNNDDFALFVDSIKTQGVPLGQLDDVIAASPLLSAAQKLSLLSAVPEPTTCSMLVVAGMAVLARRRGRSKTS